MTEANAIALTGWRCLRCGHGWLPRSPGGPKVCPKCKSPYWSKERRQAARPRAG